MLVSVDMGPYILVHALITGEVHILIPFTGYYVHGCKKMKYKAEYSPSHLLDPVRFPSNKFCHPNYLLMICRRIIPGGQLKFARNS